MQLPALKLLDFRLLDQECRVLLDISKIQATLWTFIYLSIYLPIMRHFKSVSEVKAPRFQVSSFTTILQ